MRRNVVRGRAKSSRCNAFDRVREQRNQSLRLPDERGDNGPAPDRPSRQIVPGIVPGPRQIPHRLLGPCGGSAPSHGSASGLPQSEAGQQDGRNVVNVGKSVVIKGELHGSEDHTIEGQVEGTIKAQVFAKALVVLGAVNDNIAVSEKGDIRDGGAVDSDIVSPRVAIAEGAHFCGSVDMQRQSVQPRQAQQPYNAVAWAAMTARRRRPATSARVPRSLAGSYLWPGRDRRRTEGRCPAPAAPPARGREDQRHKARLTDGEVGWYCRLEVGS